MGGAPPRDHRKQCYVVFGEGLYWCHYDGRGSTTWSQEQCYVVFGEGLYHVIKALSMASEQLLSGYFVDHVPRPFSCTSSFWSLNYSMQTGGRNGLWTRLDILRPLWAALEHSRITLDKSVIIPHNSSYIAETSYFSYHALPKTDKVCMHDLWPLSACS